MKQNQKKEANSRFPSQLAKVLVDPSRLKHNLQQFSGEHDLAPVIKSNAYGHGLSLVASTIKDRSDVPFVCVAAYREAVRLRAAGYTIPTLIIGYTPTAAIIENQLSEVAFTITSLQQLHELDAKLDNQQSFHLKVETGMHRYGLKPKNTDTALRIIEKNPHIEVVGAFSHFSDAYEPGSQYTQKQIDRWNQAAGQITNRISVDYLHMAATSGHFYRVDIQANVERVGIGLYGITDYASDLDLKPALAFRSRVAMTKHVLAGEPVGYNRSYQPRSDTRIAVLPVGYQEGVDRRLSNQGVVSVNENQCPIIGKVSMNATMINVDGVDNVSRGNTAEIISPDSAAPNNALNTAQEIGTIAYEILVHLSPELERQTTNFD